MRNRLKQKTEPILHNMNKLIQTKVKTCKNQLVWFKINILSVNDPFLGILVPIVGIKQIKLVLMNE